MSKKVKLTETACKNAPPNEKLLDTEIKGFALFTGKTRKTFYFQRDVNGRTRRVKLGHWPDVDARDARVTAVELANEHAQGLTAKRLRASRIPALRAATETYLAREKLRSEANKVAVRSQMHSHLKDWLDTPLDEITKADCVTMHRRVADKGKRIANHTLKSFRSIYNHARRMHELPECPTMAVEWFPEPPSGQIIEDLDKWRDVVDHIENPVHSAFYRLLLATGLRLSEALSLRWDQVRDDHLHLPMTKNGRPFDLPLVDLHHEIIAPMRAFRSDYVFPGTKHAVHLNSPTRIRWRSAGAIIGRRPPRIMHHGWRA